MKSKLSLALILLGCVSLVLLGAERISSGTGATLTTSTTPTEFVIEQVSQLDLVTNGDFGADSDWTKGTDWAIAGGVGAFTASDASTGTLTQAISAMSDDKTYRVKYTVVVTGPVTLQAQVGNSVGDEVSASGTYTSDLFLNASSNLIFTCVSTDAATCTVDNVTLQLKPEQGYASYVELSIGATELPVSVSYNCSGATFTNQYADGRTLTVTSNDTPLVIRRDNMGGAIGVRNLWYRNASGASTLRVNAN